jgi:vacuolar-type H+-ATPase subunit I/STV1
MHAGVGLLVAIFAGGVWLLAASAGMAPVAGLPAAMALSSLIAGIVKEGADWLDNRMYPGMHGVEWLDAAATALPGVVLGLVAAQVLA